MLEVRLVQSAGKGPMSNILDSYVGAYEGNNLYDFDNSILLNWYPKRIFFVRTSHHFLLFLHSSSHSD